MSNYFNGNGTIGFTCDVCGRELNSCSVVNGMKFCAKCYQKTFVKDNQQNEIQELKQQLEEKEKEIERLKAKQKPIVMHSKEDYFKRCNFLEQENIKLQFAQKQLAIQELKKVKKQLRQNITITMPINEIQKFKDYLISVDDFIDNQIKNMEENK